MIDSGESGEAGDLEALTVACEIVGDRWSLPIVAALLDGPLRYTELQNRLPGIAPNILTARLRKLDEQGLVVSSRYSARPPRFDYRLTGDATALADPIRLLASWAAGRTGPSGAPVHDACGTPLQARLWCPACETTAEPSDDVVLLA
jgi:DNA-binding HxlR family transcriptional regulator